MKKRLLFLFGIGSLMLSGCVSSSRMSRMSGGVFEEYSAPPSFRLRSEKFRKKTPFADPARRANAPDVSGLNDTLINIWPFFFRNNAYWSMLWPFIDCDDYGFAIRPFYVQDGDEYSVLFPFSAWNPENKDGWVANFVWNKDGFGFVPFSWQNTKKDHGWFYYTPLFIHRYDERPIRTLGKNRYHREDYFTEFMLAFWQKKSQVIIPDKYQWLFNYWNHDDIGGTELAYHFSKFGKPAPKNMNELRAFEADIYKTLPVKTGYSYGFFPLFGYEKMPNGNTEFMFLLNEIKRSQKRFSWSIFGRIAEYENQELDSAHLHLDATEEFFSLPLLTKIKTTKYFANTGAVKTLRELYALRNDNRKSYSQDLPRIKELIKELDPKLELPKSVVDYETLRLFLYDWQKGKTFPVEKSYSGGNLLLFFYTINSSYRNYFYPILLTRYKATGDSSNFWSIPIMTFVNKSKNSSFTGVFPPLVYMKSSERNPLGYSTKIYSSDTKMAEKWDVVEEEDLYAALGLFYRGRIAFNVAKKGFKGSELDSLRMKLLSLWRDKDFIKDEWERHQKENNRIAAWVTKDKIEYYEKCIAIEEAKIKAGKIRELEKKYAEKWNEAKATAASLNFKLSEADVADQVTSVKTVDRLLKDYTELRWKEDIGNSFLYRKEKFYNGDYNWRLFGFLASGEKVGSKENTNVLHLLYRYRRDGDRSETLFFPFVSIVKDGKDSKFSFLWRVFQLKEEKGKTGGYILFIPF